MNKIDRLKKLSQIESKGTVKFERKLTMMPIGNYFDSRTSFSNGGDHYHHHHHVLGCSTLIEMEDGGGGSNTSSRIPSMSTEKSMSASKSHSEAERRRRERINAHLATLRTLLPNTTKTDKASLLAEVVQHVKQLKKLADAAAKDGHDGCIGEWPFPGETDELTLGYCDESDEESSSSLSEKRKKRVLIRVTVSCEDRPEFVSDLTRALRTVRARVVRAEMATVGGRTKSALLIQGRGNGDDDDDELLGTLRRALKAILDKPAVSGRGQVVSGNKRPRLSHSHCY